MSVPRHTPKGFRSIGWSNPPNGVTSPQAWTVLSCSLQFAYMCDYHGVSMFNLRMILGLALLTIQFSTPALSQGSSESLQEGVRLRDLTPAVWGYTGSQTAISGPWMFVASGHGGTPSVPHTGKVTDMGFPILVSGQSPHTGNQHHWSYCRDVPLNPVRERLQDGTPCQQS